MGKVIFIDDDPAFLEMMRLMVEANTAHTVMVLQDPTHALDTIRDNKPDLIFLDIVMPGVSGVEVIRSIKDDPELRDIPVVFLSAASPALVKAVHEIGDMACVKPVRIETILSIIEFYLEK